MQAKRRVALVIGIGAAAVVAIGALLAFAGWLGARTGDQPTHRSGPPALVDAGGTPTLWLLTRHVQRRSSGWRTHFDLHGHDPVTTERRWSRRLLTLHDRDHNAAAHLLGRAGDVVWAFVHDQPVALAAADGRVLATGAKLAETNPGLAPMWPRARRSFAFDGGALVVTTADALHWRIDPATWRATSYGPEDDDAFAAARFRAAQWNGAWRTEDFVTRQVTQPDGRWVGLFAEREAADAADDPSGDHYAEPERVFREGTATRRTLYVASVSTARSGNGTRPRVQSLRAAGGGAAYLDGGFLKRPGRREAVLPASDGGAIVVHKSRLDDDGTLVLTRLDAQLQPRWTHALPIAEIGHRWELPGRLLLFGSIVRNDGTHRRLDELLVSVDLDDGSVRRRRVGDERGE